MLLVMDVSIFVVKYKYKECYNTSILLSPPCHPIWKAEFKKATNKKALSYIL